jgi:hypothetical protein
VRAAGIALNLNDQILRAANPQRQRILGQIERFAAAAQPASKGGDYFRHACP